MINQGLLPFKVKELTFLSVCVLMFNLIFFSWKIQLQKTISHHGKRRMQLHWSLHQNKHLTSVTAFIFIILKFIMLLISNPSPQIT